MAARTSKTAATVATMTLGNLVPKFGTVFTSINGVALSAPVFGNVFTKGSDVQVVTSGVVDLVTGQVTKNTAESKVDLAHVHLLPASTPVEATQNLAVLPVGTVGARTCKQSAAHRDEAYARADVTLTAEGHVFNYLRPDKYLTNQCIVCDKRWAKAAAERAKTKADAAKAAEDQAAKDAEAARLAEANEAQDAPKAPAKRSRKPKAEVPATLAG